MALSLAESHTFAINSVVSRWGYVNDKAKKGDLLFPGKAPGTSYLAAPAVWLGLKVSALRGVEATKQAVVAWARLGATTLPLLLFFAFYLRATRWVTEDLPTRLLGFLMLALGSTMLSYGGLAVSHSVAAASSFGGYLLVLGHRREPDRPALPLLAGLCFGGAQAHVLPTADGPLPFTCSGSIGGAASVFEQADDVVTVQDAELGLEAQQGAVFSHHAHAQGVKGADQHFLCRGANQAFGALAHFCGSLVGEGDGSDALRGQARLDQARNFVGDDPCFARTRPGKHQARPLHEIDSFLLREIQTR